MDTSPSPNAPPSPAKWDAIFAEVNAWRGACLHHFSTVEMAVTETLFDLSAAAPTGTGVRLRHLIGQRLEDLAVAISPDGPFKEVGKSAFIELSQFREKHESFRNLLCHGVVKITVERSGQWVLVMRVLSIRSRQAERNALALEKDEADALLTALKRDGQRLTSALGQLRKAVNAA
ncbi:hypothetical protein E5675_05565 [Sphingopyxis sp. PAMC25046]|uniref:hypothetical protein n=1 Tax=Sphingopyxis sp. PAMC25046 TaxID=2565556 RepID=UPI00109D9A23|nr:hypothetical protein [Sphingopyxis sp. PAMC25046]QCB53955.1 hypothetical protein E5675_05565 [Sphingopyxis sp. PAMC25046]